ncbi:MULTISPECIES: hypothetical protein [Xanthobacter]|uniref:hypothetical protein n=1 Tax=Xanthobacter TaxID=279 RepID=UPI001E3DD782|nr:MULTISPECIES: hypothetical protein [Xanthobacter]UDQ90587.1 hypothetical protein LJE71_06160 [Xanthobacter autotrophicus]UJX43293.1 hypothetical protein D7006_00030 [Xanthobacter sp. YC-JY1]
MKSICGKVVSSSIAAAAIGLSLGAAQAADLELTPGKIYTDAAGAYVSVAVKNSGAATAAEVKVTCEFFAGKRALGKASTTLFSIVGGVTGTDQVRFLGGTSATSATCTLAGQK